VRRVVADTNVLVSAIRFGGKPKQLLDLAADGHIDLAISESILEETLRRPEETRSATCPRNSERLKSSCGSGLFSLNRHSTACHIRKP
jgi:predicted nucleic acid-binding protein